MPAAMPAASELSSFPAEHLHLSGDGVDVDAVPGAPPSTLPRVPALPPAPAAANGNRSTRRKVPSAAAAAAAKGSEDAVLLAGDGGLVRGVVSHVSALMRSASASEGQHKHQHQQHQQHAPCLTQAAAVPSSCSSADVGLLCGNNGPGGGGGGGGGGDGRVMKKEVAGPV